MCLHPRSVCVNDSFLVAHGGWLSNVGLIVAYYYWFSHVVIVLDHWSRFLWWCGTCDDAFIYCALYLHIAMSLISELPLTYATAGARLQLTSSTPTMDAYQSLTPALKSPSGLCIDNVKMPFWVHATNLQPQRNNRTGWYGSTLMGSRFSLLLWWYQRCGPFSSDEFILRFTHCPPHPGIHWSYT